MRSPVSFFLCVAKQVDTFVHRGTTLINTRFCVDKSVDKWTKGGPTHEHNIYQTILIDHRIDRVV